jgi:hypothetical protein
MEDYLRSEPVFDVQPIPGYHRGAVARHRIRRGELIHLDVPYLVGTDPSLDLVRCCLCGTSSESSGPIACPDCGRVVFCTRSCFDAYHSDHRDLGECFVLRELNQRLSRLPKTVLDTLNPMVDRLRCISSLFFGRKHLLSERNAAAPSSSSSSSTVSSMGYLYRRLRERESAKSTRESRSDPYAGLDSNVEQLSGSQREQYLQLMALYCLVWKDVSPSALAGSPRESMGESTNAGRPTEGEWLENCLRIQCNAFGLTEVSPATETNPQRQRGLAVYLSSSFFNHSCSPNVGFFRRGRFLAFIALEDIDEGAQLFISYVKAGLTVAERQKKLKETYFFDCRCDRCLAETSTGTLTVPPHSLVSCFQCDRNGSRPLHSAECLLPKFEAINLIRTECSSSFRLPLQCLHCEAEGDAEEFILLGSK